MAEGFAFGGLAGVGRACVFGDWVWSDFPERRVAGACFPEDATVLVRQEPGMFGSLICLRVFDLHHLQARGTGRLRARLRTWALDVSSRRFGRRGLRNGLAVRRDDEARSLGQGRELGAGRGEDRGPPLRRRNQLDHNGLLGQGRRMEEEIDERENGDVGEQGRQEQRPHEVAIGVAAASP